MSLSPSPAWMESCAHVARSRAGALLLISSAALALGLPILLYGPMVLGHDTYQHLNFASHFSRQFHTGEWYPRWLLAINHGLGSPSLFVYPPVPSYVFAFLQPAAEVLHFNAFNVGQFLALLLSGIFAYLWLQTLASRPIAVLCAILYMLMPYHLAVDFYRRDALPECWALAWMPLILYFTAGILQEKPRAFAGFALAYALLILSHLVTIAMFSVIPLTLAMVEAPKGKKLKQFLGVGCAMALGTALSCFYLLPALEHSKYFPVDRLLHPPQYVVSSQLIHFRALLPHDSPVGFLRSVWIVTLIMGAFIALCAAAIWKSEAPEARRKMLFWLAVSAPPLFLVTSLSTRIWNSSAQLFHMIQYPWRFGIIVCISAIAMAALCLSEIGHLSNTWRWATLALASVVMLTWLASYVLVWQRYHTEVFIPRPLVSHPLLVNDDDGWFDSWTAPGLIPESALAASKGPRVGFTASEGKSDATVWEPRHIEFDTDSATGGWVAVHQFYYPGWTASLSVSGSPLRARALVPEGLLEIEVPSGHQQVRADIPVSTLERAGSWISGVAVAATLALALRRAGPVVLPTS